MNYLLSEEGFYSTEEDTSSFISLLQEHTGVVQNDFPRTENEAFDFQYISCCNDDYSFLSVNQVVTVTLVPITVRKRMWEDFVNAAKALKQIWQIGIENVNKKGMP